MQNLIVKKRDYFESRFRTILNTILHKRSIKHINAGYPNLVVFAFDHIGHSISIDGIYEKEELEIIQGWLQKNNLIRGAALDIGANIGNHSIFFSKMYNAVYSFEPHPLTTKLLQMNIDLFSKNVKIFPIGLSDKEGMIPFFLAKNANMMGAKLIFTGNENFNDDEVTQVLVSSLDSIAEVKDVEIGLIKIDVEGAELNVLKGGVHLITHNKPVILFEQHVEDFSDGKSSVIEYLTELGYQFFVIKTSPQRSGSNSKLKRLSNLFVEQLFGRKYEITECENFKPDFYNMIIAIQK